MRGKASPAPLELRPEVGCAVNVSAGGGGGCRVATPPSAGLGDPGLEVHASRLE